MRTAVVVGAGMAGLATAGELARAGWQVTVLERAERVAAPPTALVLWANGRKALESLNPDGGWAGIALASAWIAAGDERPSLLSQLPWLALGIGLALGGGVPALVLTWGVDAGA